MNAGWVRLHRKTLDSSVWANPKVWMVWSWCLMKANHEPKKFLWNGNDITVGPGQFITGIDRAVAELRGISAQSYRTAISYLQNTERLTIKTTNKFSLVTIKKWDEYQPSNKPLTNQQQTTNKPLTTNKNEKNVRMKRTLSKDNEATPRKSGGIPPKGTILLPHEPTSMNDRIDHSFPRHRLYGDEKINWLLDYAEHKLGRALSGQERWNRIYAKHLATKVGMGKAKELMDAALVPENWWFDKIAQFATLYKNWDRITAFTQDKPKDGVETKRRMNVTII